jgi:hypothetical protein
MVEDAAKSDEVDDTLVLDPQSAVELDRHGRRT